MLDYYSQISMPSAKTRKNNLIDYAKNNNINYTEELIDRIISETPEYSVSGYAMFGLQDEINKLKKG